jgi:hypothetical protein
MFKTIWHIEIIPTWNVSHFVALMAMKWKLKQQWIKNSTNLYLITSTHICVTVGNPIIERGRVNLFKIYVHIQTRTWISIVIYYGLYCSMIWGERLLLVVLKLVEFFIHCCLSFHFIAISATKKTRRYLI